MIAPEYLTAPAAALRTDAEGGEQTVTRALAREHRLSLSVDGAPFARLVCTRSLLQELVLGRLCTAGRIADAAEVLSLEFSPSEDRAEVRLRSGAGDAAAEIKPIAWRGEDIFRLAVTLRESMPLHDETRGTHGAALLHGGAVLCCCEDIGRHNAIDKAVGAALARGVPLRESILYTTGRIAVDIAEKAITAGVPVLVSRTLPTADALERAKATGLTIIGRAWEQQFEVFTR